MRTRPNRAEKAPIRAVIFDYGNVICFKQLPSDVESMAAVCGIAMPRFQQLYWKFRMPYDRGDVTAEAYWNAVAAEESVVLSPQQIAELTWLDTQGWARPNPKTIKWAEQLHGAGLRLGLLSNMPSDLSSYLLANGEWVQFFHHLTFSCDVRMVKPDPAIYHACLAPLQVPPEEVLFLDDLADNIEAAAKIGIRAVTFDTIEQTVARVSEHFDVPVPDFAAIDIPG